MKTAKLNPRFLWRTNAWKKMSRHTQETWLIFKGMQDCLQDGEDQLNRYKALLRQHNPPMRFAVDAFPDCLWIYEEKRRRC